MQRNAAILAHPSPHAKLALNVDASNHAIGDELQQIGKEGPEPLAFFSKCLSPCLQKASTYDRELYAIYESIRYFKDLLEAREFCVYTDHKPLETAFQQRPERVNPTQQRRLCFISEFTTDIRHVSGEQNKIADMLSRVDAINTDTIDYEHMAKLHRTDTETIQYMKQAPANSTLALKELIMPGTKTTLFCNTSTANIRPFVPLHFRNQIIEKLHNTSHPGIRATTHLVSERFVTPSIRKDCKHFVPHCLACQKNKNNSPQSHADKSHKRTRPPILSRAHRFNWATSTIRRESLLSNNDRQIHSVARGDSTSEYDRRNRGKAFVTHWVARFGVPSKVTTDQGRQFDSELFKRIFETLGIDHLRTTPYHPQANGQIERVHRQLKSAIMCHNRKRWTDALPLVLLGLRSSLKKDIGSTVAELTYGTTLRLPGEFFDTSKTVAKVTPEYVESLKQISFSHSLSPISFNYTLSNSSLSLVLSIRDLGIILDSRLNFKLQLDEVLLKANRTLGF